MWVNKRNNRELCLVLTEWNGEIVHRRKKKDNTACIYFWNNLIIMLWLGEIATKGNSKVTLLWKLWNVVTANVVRLLDDWENEWVILRDFHLDWLNERSHSCIHCTRWSKSSWSNVWSDGDLIVPTHLQSSAKRSKGKDLVREGRSLTIKEKVNGPECYTLRNTRSSWQKWRAHTVNYWDVLESVFDIGTKPDQWHQIPCYNLISKRP